jgi:hypothetical protein
MYPVNFRSLEQYARFLKWQFIDARWGPPRKDSRPESRRVFQATIRAGDLLKPGRGWAARRAWLDPIVDRSLHTLDDQRVSIGRSLGVIRPEAIQSLVIRPAKPWSEAAKQGLEQLTLSLTGSRSPRRELEPVPFDFVYRFRCNDERCTGHEMEIFRLGGRPSLSKLALALWRSWLGGGVPTEVGDRATEPRPSPRPWNALAPPGDLDDRRCPLPASP